MALSNIAYEIISNHADDMRDWQSQFSEYSLSHIIDLAYSYLDDGFSEETEDDRNQLADKVGEEIWLVASAVWNECESEEDDE